MGSCPLLTPPAGGWILDSRINKAILKCAAIAAKISLKLDLKRTDKPSAQDKTPSAQDNPPSARQKNSRLPKTNGRLQDKTKLFLYKAVLAQSANGANPVLGNILELCACGDSFFGSAFRFVVYIAAGANIFSHNKAFLSERDTLLTKNSFSQIFIIIHSEAPKTFCRVLEYRQRLYRLSRSPRRFFGCI